MGWNVDNDSEFSFRSSLFIYILFSFLLLVQKKTVDTYLIEKISQTLKNVRMCFDCSEFLRPNECTLNFADPHERAYNFSDHYRMCFKLFEPL